MKKYIPTFTEITDWEKNLFSGTGGTRAKKIYYNPIDYAQYFFKGSKELPDGALRYPLEYWSEIVASKVGQWLGFNMLDYNIGYDSNSKQQIGCLSKTMLEHYEDTLSEGIEYLRGFKPKYDPEKDKDDYDFEFIKKALTRFELDGHLSHFVKMLIFDSIIGNSDRHQENWGFVSSYSKAVSELDERIRNEHVSIIRKIDIFLQKMILKLSKERLRIDMIQKNRPSKTSLLHQSIFTDIKFAPIYDSGCCFGRELEDEKIFELLTNQNSLQRYIGNGRSEVRFTIGKKPKHDELLTQLYSSYNMVFSNVKEYIKNVYSDEALNSIINDIDINLPEELNHFKLPENRKQLMIKLIALRIDNFLKF